jgi:hypothetical protein
MMTSGTTDNGAVGAADALAWKPDWAQAKQRLAAWWHGEGPAVCLLAPRDRPCEDIQPPSPPADVTARWTDPVYRRRRAEYEMAHTWFAAEAFPFFDTEIGPGSLGVMLGSEPGFAEDTVWYEPCIDDPEKHPPLRFKPTGNRWWDAHLAVIDEGLRNANGRYLVGVPDLIENIDTLAALRGTEQLLFDLIERPAWVHQRLEEINDAYRTAFEMIYERVRDTDGGNAFSAFHLWGPGRTAKVQCDLCCMISPPMFKEFVAPYLNRQCAQLDYTMYHLDGPGAIKHLDALLAIDTIAAIEYTPGAGNPKGGEPCWHELYRRIRRGGKSVQAVGVRPDQVVQIFDAVGPEGVFLWVNSESQTQAEKLLNQIEPYYN